MPWSWTLPLFAWCAGLAALAAAQPAPADRLGYKPKGPPPLQTVNRGGGDAGGATILFIAPERFGRTTQERPTVYFFLQAKAPVDVVVTVTAEGEAEPLIQEKLAGMAEGVHPFTVRDDRKLESGRKYQCVVAIATGRQRTRKDPHHVSWIEYRPAPPALAATLQRQASKYERAKVYFEESIWCDGLACIYDVIRSKPQDAKHLRKQLVKVYEEVNLPEVAEFEAKLLEQ